MSDAEDMDVDGGGLQDAMTFSARATEKKGKSSAANLPIEAQDSLPWCADGLHIILLEPFMLTSNLKGGKVSAGHLGRRIWPQRRLGHYQ